VLLGSKDVNGNEEALPFESPLLGVGGADAKGTNIQLPKISIKRLSCVHLMGMVPCMGHGGADQL